MKLSNRYPVEESPLLVTFAHGSEVGRGNVRARVSENLCHLIGDQTRGRHLMEITELGSTCGRGFRTRRL